MRRYLLSIAATFGAFLLLTPAPSVARVPSGFVGMMADGPIFDPHVNLAHQLDSMVASGVESLRVTVVWSTAQPYRTLAEVPADRRSEFQDIGGVPTSFGVIDRLVALAAARGLTVLPQIEYAPNWAARHPGNPASPPASPKQYASFVAALVRRYGSRGTFWSQNRSLPAVPIRMWQIWNEPDINLYWSDQPWQRDYVNLLRAAHNAIKAADPAAQVVLAGFPNLAWQSVAEVYKVRGARSLFDVVAVHPYTSEARGVLVILRRVREVMNRYGDTQKPMLATELGWPSSLHVVKANRLGGWTQAGQAKRVGQVVPLLARHRHALHLVGFYYYTWIGHENFPGEQSFDFAGLLSFRSERIFRKPALASFARGALALEACRAKARVATRCLRPAH